MLLRYDDALQWLENKGLNVTPSRLNKYKPHFKSLIENWGQETIREIIENKNYASAIHEIYEIIEIKEKLSELDLKEVNETLKKSLSGLELYSDEAIGSKAASARNFSFELYMARYFKRAGYTLNFNTLADFNAYDPVDSIFVECKRPAKEETLEKNIKEALDQAIKRFTDDDFRSQKGIAAIDLTALLNPNQEFLITSDINIVANKLKAADEMFSPQVKKRFDRYGESCVSVIFHWRVPVFHLEKQTVGLYGRCFGVPIYKVGTPSEEVFQRFNNKLMNSVGL